MNDDVTKELVDRWLRDTPPPAPQPVAPADELQPHHVAEVFPGVTRTQQLRHGTRYHQVPVLTTAPAHWSHPPKEGPVYRLHDVILLPHRFRGRLIFAGEHEGVVYWAT